MTYKAEFCGTVFGHVGYTLANTKKQLKDILTKDQIRTIDFDLKPKAARCSILDDMCVVSINDEGCTTIQAYELLVHEAVHVFQHCCELMGEEAPSAEFEAYQIQFIASNLFAMYNDMKGI